VICALIVCALLAGSGQCDRAKVPEIVDYPAITRATDCQDFASFIRSGGLPIPGNFKVMRAEMIQAPQTQTAQEPRR
jgi:hypothetical protein